MGIPCVLSLKSSDLFQLQTCGGLTARPTAGSVMGGPTRTVPCIERARQKGPAARSAVAPKFLVAFICIEPGVTLSTGISVRGTLPYHRHVSSSYMGIRQPFGK